MRLSGGRRFHTGTERLADRFPSDGQLSTHSFCLNFGLLARKRRIGGNSMLAV